MKNTRLVSPVELTVAAEAGLMLVVRLTTAGVVTRAGLTIDAMDNLKIAVEEACSCLIGQASSPRRLSLTYVCRDGALFIGIRGVDFTETSGGLDETELDVVRCILEALADGVTFEVRDGRIAFIELRAALV